MSPGSRVGRAARHVPLLAFAALVVGPLALVVFTTFKTTAELYAAPLSPPGTLRTEAYGDLLATASMGIYFRNSVVVTVATVAIVLVAGSLVAHAVARLRGWIATALFAFFVAGLMVAPQVYMSPLFVVVDYLGLVNRLPGVVLVTAAAQLPIAVLVLTGFMRGIPSDLLDAAEVDGATEWSLYRRIVVPLTAPAFATLGIVSLVITWNDLLFPLLFLRSDAVRTLPLALLSFRGEYVTNYPVLFAGVVLATLPLLVAYVFLQRYFIEGMTAGSVKG